MNNTRRLIGQVLLLWVLAPVAQGAGASEAQPVALENARVRFQIWPATGRYEMLDKASGERWQSHPLASRFGEATLRLEGKPQRVDLGPCQVRHAGQRIEVVFQPVTATPAAAVTVHITLGGDRRSLDFDYEAAPGLGVENIRLLDHGLWMTDRDHGYVVVPVREGLLVPADSGLAFTHNFGTFEYEGCHMEMIGAVKNGSAVLVTWHDPYLGVELESARTNAPGLESQQLLAVSLNLRKSARAFTLGFLGKGDYVSIAQAYRPVAQAKGWRVTWDQKLAGHPERAKLLGAVNFKLWSALDRRMSEDSTREEKATVNWTFDEAAQIAEHLKQDLKLDKVLFLLGGWIHRGYDNQHPDILPAAPECGGDTAFADCARRVMKLGYLFGLHDNYQDIYRDSPSWNEDFVMRNAAGNLVAGGHWAGGRAYLTCSRKALELARRPQNLPAVRALTGADTYFIDTTYAAGLQECFATNHPLTKWDDLRWKQALSDYAREIFPVFGSECGREWAVPHADFFEGLTGVSGTYYHNKELTKKLGATVVPWFEMVYRDCLAMYGKYGYDIHQSAEYVLHHLALGRPLHYHNLPQHLYWQRPAAPRATADGLFVRADHGWAEGLHPWDRFLKNTYEVLSPLYELTARQLVTQHQFLTPDRRVQRTVFGAGRRAVEVVVNMGREPYRHQSRAHGEVVLPPEGFVIDALGFGAFHALSWGGHTYAEAPLFTLRSLDDRPLNRSQRLRIYHGFGDPQVLVGGRLRTVAKEASD